MRKIPFKNYVILGLVFLFTIGVVFYARDWYNTTKEYYMQNSVMKDAIREIKNLFYMWLLVKIWRLKILKISLKI